MIEVKRIKIIVFSCLSEKIRMIMRQKSFIFLEKFLQREVLDRFIWKKQRIMLLR